MNELLPCPFCASLPVLAQSAETKAWSVVCDGDECVGAQEGWYTAAFAVEAWNRRESTPPLPAAEPTSSPAPTTSPAPWYSRRHANGVSIYDSHNHTVAHYICNPADAKLMLAAPSLVSAVQAAICLLETLPARLHDAETFRVLENLRIAYTLAEYSGDGAKNEAR